jgi:hypothetical protein
MEVITNSHVPKGHPTTATFHPSTMDATPTPTHTPGTLFGQFRTARWNEVVGGLGIGAMLAIIAFYFIYSLTLGRYRYYWSVIFKGGFGMVDERKLDGEGGIA